MVASGRGWADVLTGVAAPSDHSVWIDVFTVFLMTCGAVMSLLLVIHLWKGLFRMRRETGPIPPGNLRHGIWTIAIMVVSAALLFGAYEWGRAEWGARTGAAIAIGTFVLVALGWFSWFTMMVRRDASRDRERLERPDHTPGGG